MNQKLFNVIMFATGAAIGSLVTWKVVKTKYERIIQEEVDSFKEEYARCMSRQSSAADSNDADQSEDDSEDEEDEPFDEATIRAYHEIASRYNTSGDDAEIDEEGEGDEEVPYINGPYVISPEDFGDGNYDHSLYCLSYYADGVLANDWNEKYDLDETIGEDNIEHFGDYTEDVLYIRNERLLADYEVTRDPRNFADVLADDPQMNGYAT